MKKTMRAVVMHRHGGPEVLAVEHEWPRPQPGPGEILVLVHACALNFLDIFTREGMPGEPTPLPHITGIGAPLQRNTHFAFEELDTGALQNPQFLKEFEQLGEAVSIRESGRAQ